MSSTFYVRVRGRVLGPYNTQQLKDLRDRGQLHQYHEISADQSTWYPASGFADLFPEAASITPMPSSRGGSRGQDEFGPSSYRPNRSSQGRRKKGFPYLLVIGLLVLIAGGTVAIVLLTKKGGTNGNNSSGGSTVQSGFTDDQLSQAVGLVVCGRRITASDGERFEIPSSTGSCFVVSNQGHIVTNRHVIDRIEKDQRAPGLKKLQEDKNIIIEPKVWVFFQRKKHEAKILYSSDDHDMAILKIEESTPVHFSLSLNPELSRTTKVLACGFPGAAESELSDEEATKKISQEILVKQGKLPKKVEHTFNNRDFEFSMTTGSVSRVVKEEGGRVWVQHNADIIHGNSGGPLITENGYVVGINTRVTPRELGNSVQIVSGIYWALSIPQLKKEIDAHVMGIDWR